ncbi:MAG: hypothetical protein P1P84_19840 [Deferrisomatales bacterium]|nr:hypothetical protein [Deferrisomatales bacterium]
MRRGATARDLVLGVLAVAGVTAIVVALAGGAPAAVGRELLLGAFGSWSKFARVLTVWVPLTLCACGLLFPFRVGLWNIGVEGQVLVGAIGACGVLRAAPVGGVPGLWVPLAFGAAAVLAAIWAVLAGVLRTRAGVNEIFAGLGLNFVAQGAVLWLIFGPWKRAGVASMSGTAPLPRELWLDALSWGRVSLTALVLAVLAVAASGLLLHYTRVGLTLRAVGRNPTAAALFGLRPGRTMVGGMAAAGALAGVAGAVQVAAVYHRLIPAISSGYGYLALLVAMLAGYRVSWVPPVALFFAALNVGSVQLPLVLQLDSSLSGVIQGVLVLVALWVGARRRRRGEGG